VNQFFNVFRGFSSPFVYFFAKNSAKNWFTEPSHSLRFNCVSEPRPSGSRNFFLLAKVPTPWRSRLGYAVESTTSGYFTVWV